MRTKQTYTFALLIFLSLVAYSLTGCGLRSVPSEAEASPTTPPAATSTPPPTPIPPTPDPKDTWMQYENPVYGFAFQYRGHWSIEEIDPMGTQANRGLILLSGSTQISIDFGFVFDYMGIPIPDTSLGMIEAAEPVSFLGETINRSIITDGGQVKWVYYPEPGKVAILDDLFFYIQLVETTDLALNEIELSTELQDEVDEILASFTRIERSGSPPDPNPGWQTYINEPYGFTFRYPSDWTVEDTLFEIIPSLMQNTVLIQKEKYNMDIGYDYSENYLPVLTNLIGGLLALEGTIPFLDNEIEKFTLIYENKDKAVFYNGLEAVQTGELTFRISLQENTAGAGYDILEVPDGIQGEAEAILATFRQVQASADPAPPGVMSEGKERFLTFDSCFDLDEGIEKANEDLTCDFTLARTGNDLRIDFSPVSPAAFGFNNVFISEPTTAQCAQLTDYSSRKETIVPLDANHVCYQSNAGRYGFLIFRAVTSDGASFDWHTFTTAGPLAQPGRDQNAAITLKDVTVPDGTLFEPGEAFTKTWQLMNTGKTTWTTGYAIRFKEGDRLAAPYEVAIPHQVGPGGAVNISVEMVAPDKPGEYISHWVLRDEQGNVFGMGADGTETFWALIVVEETQEPQEEQPTSQDSPVIETTLEVDPSQFTGTCPATLTVTFSITSEGVDRYTYELLAGATQAGYQFFLPDAQVMNVDSGETRKELTYTLTMQNSVDGWLQLVVTEPGMYRSEKVNFSVVCE